ncbi:MAG: 23S rRNA (pseudouridine(1915)-N(3))-methyltransferase RlmH [Fluviibacter phosphoraccumulans]
MRLHLISVGQRLPDWATAACSDYLKRFPRSQPIVLHEIKAEPRTGNRTAQQIMESEAVRIEAAIPAGARRIMLDERGTDITTVALAKRLEYWQGEAQDVALIIGGADGIAPALKSTAHEMIRLSSLTLPHAMARVLLAEQLYRAMTVLSGHPYHRE